MPLHDARIETMDREELRELQLARLQATVANVYENVPYYRKKLEETGVHPSDIKTLEDVRLLPFTDKTALRDTYPFGLFARPLDEVVRLHSSSGTTGKPIVVGYTRNDLDNWTELTARVGAEAGVTAGDRIDMAFLYGMFTGGWGMHYGLEHLGATIIPAGSGNTERHLMMMRDFGTTVLVSTPSYALYLAEVGEKNGYDFAKLPLRVGLFGGEPCSGRLREEIEERLHIIATDNYGLSEVNGPGVAGECTVKNGMHIAEDQFLAEIVDPETGAPLPEGSRGELVLTPLLKEAFPVLRYRTHDLTRIHYEPCACGRTLARMETVRQRTDDMLIIRGVNVFPSQIEDVLLKRDGVKPHYRIVLETVHNLDDLTIQLEVDPGFFSDKMRDMEKTQREIAQAIHSVLGLRSTIQLVEPGTLERTQGKSKKVIDNRIKD